MCVRQNLRQHGNKLTKIGTKSESCGFDIEENNEILETEPCFLDKIINDDKYHYKLMAAVAIFH